MTAVVSPVCEFFREKDLSLISIGCMPGGGKTTLRELLVTVLTHPVSMRDAVLSADMSDLLAVNAVGRSEGALVTNDIVGTALTSHLAEKLRHNDRISTVVLSGWPRDVKQGEESGSCKRRAILYLDTPEHVARKRYLNRWKNTPPSKRRPDDPQTLHAANKMFHDRKTVFDATVIPMVDANSDRVVRVDSSAPLLTQLTDIIFSLANLPNPPILGSVASRVLEALEENSHPVHSMIEEIERPVSPLRTATVVDIEASNLALPSMAPA